jgi:hypothetical protein
VARRGGVRCLMCVTHGPWFPSLHAIFSKVETDEIVQCLQIQDAFRVSTASGVGTLLQVCTEGACGDLMSLFPEVDL